MMGSLVRGTDDVTNGADGRWLTYDELAKVRGIKRIGAVRLAKRQNWRRQPGNDGKVRVMVPTEALAMVRGTRQPHLEADHPLNGALTGDLTGDLTNDLTNDGTVAAAFESALTVIREAHAGEVRALREHLAVTQERANRAEEALQDAQEAARIATDALKAARQAEEVRKGRGRLRRAWDGWRGR